MRVFRFRTDEHQYVISGVNEEAAHEEFYDLGLGPLVSCEEVPESEWDERYIKLYEDNDTSTEPFYCSIRELLSEFSSELISTTDTDFWE